LRRKFIILLIIQTLTQKKKKLQRTWNNQDSSGVTLHVRHVRPTRYNKHWGQC
jgi:hypothetical protein